MENSKIYLSFFLYKSRKNKKGAPVYLKISLPHEQGQLCTGVSIDERYWNSNRYEVKPSKPEYKELNRQLSTFKSNVLAIFNDCQEKSIPVSIEGIKQRLNNGNSDVRTLLEAFEIHSNLLKQKVGIETTKATVTKYETLRKKVERYKCFISRDRAYAVNPPLHVCQVRNERQQHFT